MADPNDSFRSFKRQVDLPRVYVNKAKKKLEATSEETEKTGETLERPRSLEELDQILDRKAEENNFSVINVKNMIKAVLTNEDVIKMMDDKDESSGSADLPKYELKLTRAKKRALMASFNLSSPETKVKGLIDEEWPEDSSDEEYNPCEDHMSSCPSDDETTKSGADDTLLEDDITELSLPPPAATPTETKENIGQRTRSKLSLSETPLEAIEQAFIPPDITTDMYNTTCENQDWLNFLKEFSKPLSETAAENVDDDNDPEYNVMMDEELDKSDKEELRADRGVKVTKKELNSLLSELVEYTDMLSSDEEEKVEPSTEMLQSTSSLPEADFSHQFSNPITLFRVEMPCVPVIQPMAPPMPGYVNPLQTTYAQTKKTCSVQLNPCASPAVESCFSDDQMLLLKQQMRQHLQLTLQNYLLSLGNPFVDESICEEFKNILNDLISLCEKASENSAFFISTLKSSFGVIKQYEQLMANRSQREEISKFIENSWNGDSTNNRKRRVASLPKALVRICLESCAFQYPLLLPTNNFKPIENFPQKRRVLKSEDRLIAMALESYVSYDEFNVDDPKQLGTICDIIQESLLPMFDKQKLLKHIRACKASRAPPNPIKTFFETKTYVGPPHYVIPLSERLLKLREQPIILLKGVWEACVRSKNVLSDAKS